jgi:tetratricopeptide (TPR) repeat protein
LKQHPDKSKAARRQKQNEPPGTPAAPLTPVRKWLFRLIALVVVPLLLLGGLEAGLRVAGYGYATALFEKVQAGDREFLLTSANFSSRFFPPQLARWPNRVAMDAKKPSDTCRIFILGESAALGDPEPSYGAGRYLEVLLRERFPGQRFEIVNVAITAINSHVILPIARECARQEGDLWIVYMGNNEMIGPFGAATVFGAQAPPWWSVRANLALQQTRVGQLMKSLAGRLRDTDTNTSWGGMQMFLGNQLQANDPRRVTVYRNFQRNLQDIVRAGLDSGAKIILNTVAVNLKDCPPFASLTNSNLPAADRAAVEAQYAGGLQAQAQGSFDEAARQFEQAARFDPQFAELQFRWGECLLQLTNHPAAHEHFQMACDADALPFRATSRINNIIRQVGGQWAGRGLSLFDAEAALATNSPAAISGAELFYEHVHFNFAGNYRLARAWAEQVEMFLPTMLKTRAPNNWATQEVCERRLGLTDWQRSAVVNSVIERLQAPPLSSQLNNARRQETFQGELSALQQRMNTNTAVNARAIFLEAIQHWPEDYSLHEHFGEFLVKIGDPKQAMDEWQQANKLLPRNFLACYELGRLLEQENKFAEAQSSFIQALTLHPRFAEAWLELGKTQASEGKFELALQQYEHARQFQPHNPKIYYYTGLALSRLKRSAEAMQNFQRAIQLKRDYWEAHFLLGGEMGLQNKIPEAKSEFEEVIRLQPGYARAHLNLGVALLKQGELDGAQKEFEETLRLEPGNQRALEYIKHTQARKNRPP